MDEQARQIIKAQWKLRNHEDPRLRLRARNLIKAHIYLLRALPAQNAA